MFSTNDMRVVLIGNSGAGKSTLGDAVAGYARCERIDLDRIHWDSHTFSTKRDPEEARQMTCAASQAQRWVIDGVYGWLAQEALARATALVWLNLPWQECEARILQRGPWRYAPEGAFEALIDWARDYDSHETSTSKRGHRNLFEFFVGEKLEIRSRAEASALIEELQRRRRS